jgi:hypothetical protein
MTTNKVARDVETLINAQAKLGRNAPDVAAMVSIAVGFACDIAECDDILGDGNGITYQVMTDHARDFWYWHLDHNEQFHATPARAAAHFVAQYRYWREQVAPQPAMEARA